MGMNVVIGRWIYGMTTLPVGKPISVVSICWVSNNNLPKSLNSSKPVLWSAVSLWSVSLFSLRLRGVSTPVSKVVVCRMPSLSQSLLSSSSTIAKSNSSLNSQPSSDMLHSVPSHQQVFYFLLLQTVLHTFPHLERTLQNIRLLFFTRRRLQRLIPLGHRTWRGSVHWVPHKTGTLIVAP